MGKEIKSSEWRDEAYERFPEMSEIISYTDSPYLLWMELNSVFTKAYQSKPVNEELIERIYGYFSWCCEQPEAAKAEDDLCTCALVCLLEHIMDVPEAIADLPWWFSREDVIDLQEFFVHKAGRKGYTKLMDSFDKFEKENPDQV